MLEEPPSIFPRGTGTRRPLRPSPALPGSAVYIQSVAGSRCIDAHAIGIEDTAGGRSPASINATRHDGSSERREAITAPAEPPSTMTKSKCSAIAYLPICEDAAAIGNVCISPCCVQAIVTASDAETPGRTPHQTPRQAPSAHSPKLHH